MDVSLDIPADLEAWRRWSRKGRPLRAIRGALRRPAPIEVVGEPEADLIVVVDAWHTSVRAALVAPLAHLDAARTAVLGPPGVSAVVPWQARVRTVAPADLGAALPGARAMLGSGHHLEPGGAAYALAATRGLPYLVAQHGLLTPKAPPLPPGAHLLAWSGSDGEFWASGRTDVRWTVTGSQLLADAATRPATPLDPTGRPIYLGQLHGAELPFASAAQAAEQFCLAHGATYRPHPSERDRRSRRTHERWRDLGIEIASDARPLRELDRPIVSVFSTGVLEAAAAGLPAYVHHPAPPAWLLGLWHRYDMHEYGTDPTPAPTPHPDPSRAIARALIEAAR